jgi:uncharacterized protein YkwD
VRTCRSALLSLLTAAALVASTALVGAAPASATTTREARMVAKINAARANHGLPALRTSPELMTAAHSHAVAMAASRTLFHTASFSTICCWTAVAENVGRGFTVRGVHRALMHSAPHRANILNGRMRQLGVGVVSAAGQLWVVEVFRQPA